MKRVLSFLMAVVLIVSLLPTHALHAHAAEASVTLDLSKSSNRTSFSTMEQVWEQNGITLTNKKEGSSSNVANYTPPRFYASSSLTIAYSGGNITKIAILCNNASYASSLQKSVTSGATAVVSGSTTTITLTTPAPSYTISSMSAQVRAGNTVTVYYEAASGGGTETTEYTVTYSVPEQVADVEAQTTTTGKVTLPSAANYKGKFDYTFAGWAEAAANGTTTKPAIYEAGAEYDVTDNVTLYAVYTYTVAGEDAGTGTEYVLTDIANIRASDEVVITMTYGTTVYALPNDGGSSAPKGVQVTLTDGKLTTVADSLKWNVGGSTGAYIFYVNGGSDYLYSLSGTGNKMRVGTTTTANANVFSIDGTYLKNNYGNYVGVYRTNPDWRCYGSKSTNINDQTLGFYVLSSGGGSATYYTSTLENAEEAPCVHTNTTTTTVPATCTAAGSTTVTCNDCKEVVSTETIAALGHDYEGKVTTAATCTTDGVTTYTCKNDASHTYTEPITATGHNYVNGTCSHCGAAEPATTAARYYIAAKRTAAGSKVYYMTNALTTSSTKRYVAEATDLTTIPEMIENPETDKVFVLEEVEDGVYIIYAEGIEGESKYLGHNSGNSGAFVTKANAKQVTLTYNDDGSVKIKFGTRKLTLNNTTNNDYFAWYESEQADVYLIPVGTPCDHSYGEGVVTAPTCDAAGYTTYTCTQCGSSYTDNTVAALGHKWDEGTVTTAATCTTNGVKTYTCKNDATHTYTETIPASHTLSSDAVVVEATCETAGSKTYTCTVCYESVSEEIPALGHEWGEGVETTPATCETAGVMTYTCSRGCTKTEAIPATGHTYDSTGTCTACGEKIDHYALVTDYAQILAGGEFVIAARVGDDFYAINNTGTGDPTAIPVAVDGTGAKMKIVWSADATIPVWTAEYFTYRTNCFSLYSTASDIYLSAVDKSFSRSENAWAWTFADASNDEGEESDGEWAVVQNDAKNDGVAYGATAYAVVSADIIDRAISLLNTSAFKTYSVRTDEFNRELYFFKLVKADTSEYTVNFVENGVTAITEKVTVEENVLIMPDYTGTAMPEGYTKFIGWVALPHTESLIAPTTIYAPGDSLPVTADMKLYALYTREDANAEGQAMSYHLVTDNNQLVIDSKYIIVGQADDGTYYAMSQNQLSDDRGASKVVPDGDGVITFAPEDMVAVFNLQQGYNTDSFAFYDVTMNKFLYCGSTTQNSLKSQSALTEAGSFAIDIISSTDAPDGYYSKIVSYLDEVQSLRYNTEHTSSFLFSCYGSNSGVDITKTALYVGVPNSTSATYYTTGLCDHQWKEETVNATCENAGYTIKTCTICGEVQVTDVQAHGHNPGEYTVTSQPTCTTTGARTSVCQNANCGKEFTETIPALGHNYVGVVTAPTCTAAGYTTYTCSRCSHSYTGDNVAALGHDYTVVPYQSEDGRTAYLERICSRDESHKEQTDLAFYSGSLTLENTLIINYNVLASVFEKGNFENPYVVFSYGNRVEDFNGEDLRIVVRDYETYTNAEGKLCYRFACPQITPSQIGDQVTAVLHASYNGKDYTHVNDSYSVAQYCYSQLEKSNDAKLKTLLVDLLGYCDAARIYTTYKADQMVSDRLTAEQKALGTTQDRTLTSVLNAKYAVVSSPKATWKAASVVMYHSVAMRFRFEAASIEGLSVKVEMDGKSYTINNTDFESAGGNNYYVFFDQMNAYQMSENVYVTVYEGDTAVSNTVCYSVESYVYAKQNDANAKLAALVKALMRYGDSAVRYRNK